MNKRLKKIIAVMSIMCITIPLFGCDNHLAKIKELEQTIEEKDKAIQGLQNDIDGLGITEESEETSLKEVEGTTVPEFKTIEGRIKFPNSLTLPICTEDVSNSHILVGSKFKFFPSNNWLTQISGSTLELSHPSKVWGSVKAISIDEPFGEADVKAQLQAFYEGFPKTKLSYRKVFIDENVAGLISSANLTIDKKPYVVNTGIIQRGEFAVLVLFAYDASDKNTVSVQQELIDLFISSGIYGEDKLKLE